jgi:arylsulfatase A-like enzyme
MSRRDPDGSLRRPSDLARAFAILGVIGLIAVVLALPGVSRPTRGDDPRPNVIIVLTDDQSMGSFPAAMPWLAEQFEDPANGWIGFSNAFLQTPLCCPSRATILTGQYSHHTGVQRNHDGELLDESQTLAVWLRDAGYTTGLFGKYLNRYPWDRGPYIPKGWDRWVAKENLDEATTYYDYPLVDQGERVFVGKSPQGYSTDYLADRAIEFIRTAPVGPPLFMLFSPSAPHAPWVPAPRDIDRVDEQPVPLTPPAVLNDVRGKPEWVRGLRAIDGAEAARLRLDQRREWATVLGVDEAIRRIVGAMRARGELDRTIVVFLTDNGYAYGQHRVVGKRCPYDPCIQTPMFIRTPFAQGGTSTFPISNVDLAPTIATLAGTEPGVVEDGVDVSPILRGDAPPEREGVLLGWAGDGDVPPWWGIRTRDFTLVENDDGFLELYDITGKIGSPDPDQLDNRARDPAYRQVLVRLRELLFGLRSQGGATG